MLRTLSSKAEKMWWITRASSIGVVAGVSVEGRVVRGEGREVMHVWGEGLGRVQNELLAPTSTAGAEGKHQNPNTHKHRGVPKTQKAQPLNPQSPNCMHLARVR